MAQQETTFDIEGSFRLIEETLRGILQRLDALEEGAATTIEIDYGGDDPEACRRHTCSYFTDYLMWSDGDPDLAHEAYHSAAKQASLHIMNCQRTHCQTCQNWEKRVRA